MSEKLIPKIEAASKSEICNLQNKLLKKNLNYINTHSKFYKKLLKKQGVNIDKIKNVEDLQHIPVTTKDDLQQYNKDFICVPERKIIDYVTTSGTLGDPVTFVLTDNDLERLAYNEYISFLCAGGKSGDIYQLMTTIDRRFMAGLAYFLGARKLGAGIVRVGNGNPELQWDTIQRVSPTSLIVVPSFILKVIEYAEAHNIDFNSTTVKSAVCIGEPLRNADFSLSLLGQRIKEKWDIKLFSTYASTEMGTAFTECEHGVGGHHHPELIIVEFLDDNNNPVHKDDLGELTITTLGVEGMPLLRFKTGDLCYHHSEVCACGRNTMRLGPIIGRKKQMIKFKGTTLYPTAFYDILNNIEGVNAYVVEVFTNSIGTDELTVHIDARFNNLKFEKKIKDNFRAKLRVTPDISFKDSATLKILQDAENGRKPRLFIDNRNNNGTKP
ncbi:MAG: AMP-binding protein [Bacteroidales bacterium]|nr:AMP-binding protein [Bacteroidales bacterium]